MAPGLEIRGFTKSYGARPVLPGLSLEIPRGLFGLLGPNGAGQTMPFRLLAIPLKAYGGTVRWEEH
jgi:ABC-2 type transport system ATP-binding protein